MQINITTDYALRCVLTLAQTEGLLTSKELGEKINVSRDFVQRIMQKLRFCGIAENEMGAKGGYRLAKPASEIFLTDIFDCMEDTMRINRCVEDDQYCSLNATSSCHMHMFYMEMQYWLSYCFDNTSIQDIVNGDMSIFTGMTPGGGAPMKSLEGMPPLKSLKNRQQVV